MGGVLKVGTEFPKTNNQFIYRYIYICLLYLSLEDEAIYVINHTPKFTAVKLKVSFLPPPSQNFISWLNEEKIILGNVKFSQTEINAKLYTQLHFILTSCSFLRKLILSI